MAWSGIADFGLGLQGYRDAQNQQSDRDYLEAQRARSTEIQGMELARLRRDDALAARMRGLATSYAPGGANELPKVPGKSVDVAQVQSDEGQQDEAAPPIPPVQRQAAALPAQTNRRGMYGAFADALDSAGKPTEAAKMRQALSSIENEGYAEIVKGVASGDDPKAIQERFNRVGNRRIADATMGPDGTYSFQYEDGSNRTMSKAQADDLGTKLGLFKKDTVVIPAGGSLAEASSGKVLATGTPKPPTRWSPEGIAAAKGLEEWKAQMKAKYGIEKGTALTQNIKMLVDKGIATDEADAFNMLHSQVTKDRGSGIVNLMRVLKAPDFTGRPADTQKLRQQAEDMYDALHGPTTPGAPRAPAAPDVQADIAAANQRMPTGFTNAAAVRDAYQSGQITRDQATTELQKFGYE